jgi:hypothetical protein
MSAAAVGQFVGLMFVGPGGIAAGRLHHFKQRVHPDELMRVHRRAAVFWIPRQIVGIDAATGVELGVVYVDLFVVSDLRADDTRAKRRTAP